MSAAGRAGDRQSSALALADCADEATHGVRLAVKDVREATGRGGPEVGALT